ncbi:hypothetical protein GCM10007977_001280 [Dactylosporangium sucinum]|uniref:Uncharacterized protein n=1 Tax=Dactylosporangium sucinum TaxID=1424081 RepID=A0A917WGP5_9ACTN|nr:hypothetical protein GCM10007977_001280 [Dactylosporangium sucinum]
MARRDGTRDGVALSGGVGRNRTESRRPDEDGRDPVGLPCRPFAGAAGIGGAGSVASGGAADSIAGWSDGASSWGRPGSSGPRRIRSASSGNMWNRTRIVMACPPGCGCQVPGMSQFWRRSTLPSSTVRSAATRTVRGVVASSLPGSGARKPCLMCDSIRASRNVEDGPCPMPLPKPIDWVEPAVNGESEMPVCSPSPGLKY